MLRRSHSTPKHFEQFYIDCMFLFQTIKKETSIGLDESYVLKVSRSVTFADIELSLSTKKSHHKVHLQWTTFRNTLCWSGQKQSPKVVNF